MVNEDINHAYRFSVEQHTEVMIFFFQRNQDGTIGRIEAAKVFVFCRELTSAKEAEKQEN